MKKISKFLAVLFALVLVLGCSFSAYADEFDDLVDDIDSVMGEYYDFSNNAGYTIDKYDVNIIVNEDNTLDVTENIVANFEVPKHGIYRYIPVVNQIKRTDGSSVNSHTRVTNVSSNMPIYDTYKSGDDYIIQLGEEDVELTGTQSYTISYTYSVGPDLLENADEFYYNFIGTGWDTTINNVTFSITMPKEFDASKLGFSTGSYGAEGTDIVDFTVEGNVISGKLTEQLDPYEGATIRLELEDGYFTLNWLAFYGRYILMIGASLLALLIVFILWAKFGRDKKIVEVVEFYPPEGMNCAEVSYWNNGAVVGTDTVPLIIELANEGYLTIEETEEKRVLHTKKSFKLIKRRDYDGNDPIKKKFFDGLFKLHDEVYENDLENRFYTTVEKIVTEISSKNRTKVFNAKSLGVRIAGWVVSILAGVFNLMMFAYTSYGTMLDMKMFGLGVLIAIISFIFAFFIRQRTDEGHEIKQRIDGFKKFLETAEKEKLELLANENPSYFYNILPYAYVLGVSDVWTKKFESIVTQPPHWYYSPYDTWNYMMFNHFIHSTMNTANKVCVSKPQSSGGGSGGGSFSGGGGFSGGGFGGGGGGAW